MTQIIVPTSDLFRDNGLREKLMSFSDILELRDRYLMGFSTRKKYLYHSRLNLLGEWTRNDLNYLEKIRRYRPFGISFHLLSQFKNTKLIQTPRGEYLVGIGTPYNVEEMLQNAHTNIRRIKSMFGIDIDILAENVPHALTKVYDTVTDPDFICDVIEGNNIYLLFDIAHAKVTAVNKKYDFWEYVNSLPLQCCKQVHISGCKVDFNYAYDAHNPACDEDWYIFRKVLKLVKNLDFVTLEYYRRGDILLEQMKKLKNILEEKDTNESI